VRVAVVGGGPAGLFTALLVKRRRLAREVVVWERDREETAGFGVILPPEAFGLVRRTVPRLASVVAEHLVHWRTTTVRLGGESRTIGTPALSAIARSDMNRMLWEACGAEGVILRERGAPRLSALSTAYDLVVRADGAGAPVEDAGFDVTVREVGLPYAWLGLDTVVDGLTFLAEPSADGLYMAHAYPYSNTASTFLVEGPRALGQAELSRLFGVAVRTSPSQEAQSWRMFRERTVWPWSRENVVLVGDAAHTTHYSIGYGTFLAFEDAVALVESLTSAPALEPALWAYEQARRPVIELAQEQGRLSAEWFANAADELDLPLTRFAASLLTRGGRLLGEREPSPEVQRPAHRLCPNHHEG
jgi:2-polyprenyl-6-methoxyphenol hydroxylase-like FAD-dependent oxidoreductase